MLGYLRRHHLALLALFVALGGTSYAATELPKGSVGTTQIQAHAVNQSKLSSRLERLLASLESGKAGTRGPRGPAGPAGATGAASLVGSTSAAGAPGTGSGAILAYGSGTTSGIADCLPIGDVACSTLVTPGNFSGTGASLDTAADAPLGVACLKLASGPAPSSATVIVTPVQGPSPEGHADTVAEASSILPTDCPGGDLEIRTWQVYTDDSGALANAGSVATGYAVVML
jgi:hypothetical protein